MFEHFMHFISSSDFQFVILSGSSFSRTQDRMFKLRSLLFDRPVNSKKRANKKRPAYIADLINNSPVNSTELNNIQFISQVNKLA